MTRPVRLAAVVLAAAGAAGALTACGSDGDALTVYSAQHESLVRTMLEDFTEETGIELEFRDANDSELANQIVQEGDASPADVFLTENSPAIDVVDKEGLLAPVDQSTLDQVGEQYRPASGNWVGFAARSTVLAWNPAEIGEGDLPASILDLADPAWDGQLSMEIGDVDWYLTLKEYWLEQGKSEEEVDQLFADMADGAKAVKGHTVQAELMAAGQYEVTASNYSYIVEKAKQSGAPVDYLPFVEPAIARPNGAGLMKTAANPAAGLLFTDWLLEEGQQVLTDEGLSAAIVEGDDPLSDVELIPVDIAGVIENSADLTAEYEELLSNSEVVED